MRRKSIEDRFWSKVKKTNVCWLWTAYCDKDGYGKLRIAGRDPLSLARSDGKDTQCPAHRVSWELHNGPPGDRLVLHTCHVRNCVNPDHLYLGDAQDNADDRDAADHTERGSARRLSKLTETDVEWIRAHYGRRGKGGLSMPKLAKRFDVHVSLIHKIIHNRNWRHVS